MDKKLNPSSEKFSLRDNSFLTKSNLAYMDLDNGDGFTALAAGIVNACLEHENLSQNKLLMTQLLAEHEILFPSSAIDKSLTIIERLKLKRVFPPDFAAFLHELAHVLRRKALKKIEEEPLAFCMAFHADANHLPSVAELTLSSMAALCSSLALSIKLRLVENHKPIAKTLRFGLESPLQVNLRLLNKEYSVEVSSRYFEGIKPLLLKRQNVSPIPTLSSAEHQEMMAKFRVGRAQLVQQYQSLWQRLNTAWIAHELTLDDLQTLYTEYLMKPSASIFKHYLQLGLQTFFTDLNLDNNKNKVSETKIHDLLLMYAANRMLIDEEFAKSVFGCIEKKTFDQGYDIPSP